MIVAVQQVIISILIFQHAITLSVARCLNVSLPHAGNNSFSSSALQTLLKSGTVTIANVGNFNDRCSCTTVVVFVSGLINHLTYSDHVDRSAVAPITGS